MNIKKLLVPFKFGANVDGIEQGAQRINQSEIIKSEVLEAVKIEEASIDNLKHIETVLFNHSRLAKKVDETLNLGLFPLTIGGDHSIALGSISGVTKTHKNLGVIWVDAHGDMNTNEITETGNIHGMILAALQGYGDNRLTNLYFKGVKVKSENVVIIGVRDLDVKEREFIDHLNIKYYEYDFIVKNGLQATLNASYEYLKSKVTDVHLSVDLDSINPVYAPGVSVPVEKGYKPSEVIEIINYYFDKFNIVSADIVEYNPIRDVDNKTLNILLDLIALVEKNHQSHYKQKGE